MNGRVRLVFLFIAAAVLFSVPAALKDLWRPDEPRYAEVAREMMLSGDYLVPRVNNEVYREKPPLLFWLMALASWPAGAVNAFTARVPSILAALATVVLTFGVARRMFGERVGLWSAAILATSYRFWWQSNIGQIDMLLTGCTTLSLYALWRWYETRNGRWAFVFYVGAALGLLAKGPPALVIVALGAIMFLWGQRDARRGLYLWIGLPLSVVPVLVWFLLARNAVGGEASQEVSGTFSRQIIGRIFSGVTHPEAPWFYIINFPVEWVPWALFAPWTFMYAWRMRHGGPGMRLILSWTVPALIFFHLITEKRHGYLLPLFPGYAILCARSLIALVDEGRFAWLRVTVLLTLPVALAMVVAPLIVPSDAAPDVRWLPIVAAGLILLAWTMGIVRLKAWGRWPMTLAAQAALVMLAAAIGAYPSINSHKSAKGICSPVRILARSGPVTTYDLGPLREEFIFYTETFHDFVLRAPGASTLHASNEKDSIERAKELRSKGADACAEVRLGSLTELSLDERLALERARDAALAANGLAPAALDAYVEAVRAEVGQFFDALRSGGPAVVIGPRDDWYWVLSVADAPTFLSELPQAVVGGRPMVLLANPAAVEVLRRAGYMKS